VRSQLAEVAFELFRREGFENVTVTDVANAADVSRSTFLRYFGTKEDAVLYALDAQGEKVADALRTRPADEDDWTALRRALDVSIEHYRHDPDEALAVTRLVRDTPALCSRQLEKQQSWRHALGRALTDRATSTPQGADAYAATVRAAAALDCLNIALDHWTASNGESDLEALLDQAFAALTGA
jgi:AcrR family transcriptional regulator